MDKKSWILEQNLTNPYKRVSQLHRGPFFMTSHRHDYWQLILVTDGQLQIETSSDTATLHAGAIHILPPGWEHTLTSVQGYSQLGIDLYVDCPERELVPLLERYFAQPTNCCAKLLLTFAAEINLQQEKGTPLSLAKTINLLDSLILLCAETSESSCASFEEQLSAFLDENLNRPLRLQEIAAHFYISVPQLERLCRRSYNSGVIAQLKHRRLRKAQQLLINTELSIQEVGAMVGYPDPAHFSGFFRNCLGISPRSYRMQGKYYA